LNDVKLLTTQCRDSGHLQLDLSHPVVRRRVVRSDSETGIDGDAEYEHGMREAMGQFQSFVVLKCREAQEQDGAIETAVCHAAILGEAVNLASTSGCARAAGQQRQQEIGVRRLHIAVRFDRLHIEPGCGVESGEPPHDVGCLHHVAQNRVEAGLQRVAFEQGDSEGREIAIGMRV
jgi:hypothetical protein